MTRGLFAPCAKAPYARDKSGEEAMPFIHNTVKRIVHGCGSLREAARQTRALGGTRVFIVTGPTIAGLGLHKGLCEDLLSEGLAVEVYGHAEPEPSASSIETCARAAKDFGADILIGLGGGSALDTTKAAAVLLANEGPIERYFGMDKVVHPLPPMLLVPTTAGTGSEMTSIAVLADTKNDGKWGVVSDYMYASCVILDPELALGLPASITAATGMDAFVHAMESFCGRADTLITNSLNLHAMKLIARSLRKACQNGKDLGAREDMLYASAMAGMAFSNTQNGIIHAIGTAIPSAYHIPHGVAVACLAPMCVEFNCLSRPEKYAEVAVILGEERLCDTLTLAKRAACRVRSLIRELEITEGLAHYGVRREDLPLIARRAAGNGRLLGNNPRKSSEEEILDMLEASFD